MATTLLLAMNLENSLCLPTWNLQSIMQDWETLRAAVQTRMPVTLVVRFHLRSIRDGAPGLSAELHLCHVLKSMLQVKTLAHDPTLQQIWSSLDLQGKLWSERGAAAERMPRQILMDSYTSMLPRIIRRYLEPAPLGPMPKRWEEIQEELNSLFDIDGLDDALVERQGQLKEAWEHEDYLDKEKLAKEVEDVMPVTSMLDKLCKWADDVLKQLPLPLSIQTVAGVLTLEPGSFGVAYFPLFDPAQLFKLHEYFKQGCANHLPPPSPRPSPQRQRVADAAVEGGQQLAAAPAARQNRAAATAAAAAAAAGPSAGAAAGPSKPAPKKAASTRPKQETDGSPVRKIIGPTAVSRKMQQRAAARKARDAAARALRESSEEEESEEESEEEEWEEDTTPELRAKKRKTVEVVELESTDEIEDESEQRGSGGGHGRGRALQRQAVQKQAGGAQTDANGAGPSGLIGARPSGANGAGPSGTAAGAQGPHTPHKRKPPAGTSPERLKQRRLEAAGVVGQELAPEAAKLQQEIRKLQLMQPRSPGSVRSVPGSPAAAAHDAARPPNSAPPGGARPVQAQQEEEEEEVAEQQREQRQQQQERQEGQENGDPAGGGAAAAAPAAAAASPRKERRPKNYWSEPETLRLISLYKRVVEEGGFEDVKVIWRQIKDLDEDRRYCPTGPLLLKRTNVDVKDKVRNLQRCGRL